LQKQSASTNHLRKRALPTDKLWLTDNVFNQAELQWRISMPLGTLILVLMAVPLSQTTPRAGRYAKLFAAIIIYIGYNNLLGIGRTWMEKKIVPAEIGLWWVHVLFFMGALLLMYTANNGRLPKFLRLRFLTK
jgi:lipopolysaccharide export system permease protein